MLNQDCAVQDCKPNTCRGRCDQGKSEKKPEIGIPESEAKTKGEPATWAEEQWSEEEKIIRILPDKGF